MVLRQIQPKALAGVSIRTLAHFIVSGGFLATMSMLVSHCTRFSVSRIRHRLQRKSRRSALIAGPAAGVSRHRKSASRRRPLNAKRLHCIQHERRKTSSMKSYRSEPLLPGAVQSFPKLTLLFAILCILVRNLKVTQIVRFSRTLREGSGIEEGITLVVRCTTANRSCPTCYIRSSRIHSHYQRTLKVCLPAAWPPSGS